MAKQLNIAHLYPDLMNSNGDMGNIKTLEMRSKWRDIDVRIVNINVGDEINPADFDLYFIGGGQDAQQIMVSKELQLRKDALKQASEEGAVFLSICGGYQLLGEYYQPIAGERIDGISLLDIRTEVASKDRFIGNVTVQTDLISSNTIVGFENHFGKTFLGENVKPLGKILVGNGNNGEDKTEGAYYKNTFGTYLHGALLPKNPGFADYLIKKALEYRHNEEIILKPLDDEFEQMAHKSVLNKKY